ncbi:pyroglutamyl-peptidase I [Paenibacillus aquistagni]|uniref:pyroglutamyl-peptidase I n=1 Tax=Paenibacillus aquistagni TaxID=1852522 RepID=UPI00145A3F9F|nr:pyroglutamyl-peptidase I [Paenibacillus aquistagni]NMM51676.1 pyroglutamyl-peptidase I [Paenibacillus aquistagni]
MKRILLTGFEPFMKEAINPSWEAVRRLDGERIAGYEVSACELPTVFKRAQQVLLEQIKKLRPSVVICVGQAGGRAEITVERVAINLIDARIPDNDGEAPVDVPVADEGPAAYFASIPVKTIQHQLKQAGIPCQVSYTAGTYVCNSTFYALMHAIYSMQAQDEIRGGFIHIPFLPEQAAHHPGKPSMSLEVVIEALRKAIEALDTEASAGESAGTLH